MMEGQLKVIERTKKWEDVLRLCHSEQVIYRCEVDGYPAYSKNPKDNWCVVYVYPNRL